MKPQTSTPNAIYDGIFVQSSTSLVDEIEEEVVLKRIFKEDSENKEVQHYDISPEQYDSGYKMI